MTTTPRARLKRAAEQHRAARKRRDTAIVAGRAAGMSLRDLADVSELGVETVRRVLIAQGVKP